MIFRVGCGTDFVRSKLPGTTLLLLLFASTKFCDFGIPTILRVLIFAISRSRAEFCDFAQPKVKPQLETHCDISIAWTEVHAVFV